MLILGSGGHTAELLALFGKFDLTTYTPRCYVVAATDKLSATKAKNFETASGKYSIIRIPRSREVGQSFLTSIWTTLYAALFALQSVFTVSPDLILTNGPGTAVPVVAAAVLGNILGLNSTKVVYVESIARVKHLSLTGKILYHSRWANEFFVQWEELVETYPSAAYAGRLM